jgi:uncharacterized RDD family membrane protein YckC
MSTIDETPPGGQLDRRDRDVTVERLQYMPAGLISRFTASAVDMVVIVLIAGATYAITAGAIFLIDPRSFHWPNGIGWTIPLATAVIGLPYLTLSWCIAGRTVGDNLFGLRVLTRHRQRVGFLRAVLRAFVCLLFPLGLLWIPFSRKRYSLQDIVLRTAVVYDWGLRRRTG